MSNLRPILLLDVMETLVNEPFYAAIPGHFSMSLDRLLAEKHPSSWIEFEKGKLTEEEYVQTFFADGRPVDSADLRSCLEGAYEWLEGIPELLAELRASGYAMYAVSNYSIWYEIIERKLKLSEYLDWRFVSCRTGLRKPDRATYENVLAQLQVGPEDCLFVDDRRVNVQAARQLGLDAIRFQGAAHLRGELQARGLNVAG